MRPRPRAQRRSWRVKHPLRALMAEPVLHHQKNERRVRNKSRSRQRQVVAARLKLKERPRARKQRNQRGAGHEVAKPRLLGNDHKNDQFGLTVSVNHANQPGTWAPGFFASQNRDYVVVFSTAAVSAARYFTPMSQTTPERKMIPDTNRNATCMFACPPM